MNEKVICINAECSFGLTEGKIYESYKGRYNSNKIYIKNDWSFSVSYNKTSFLTLEEFRDQKLKELGI